MELEVRQLLLRKRGRPIAGAVTPVGEQPQRKKLARGEDAWRTLSPSAPYPLLSFNWPGLSLFHPTGTRSMCEAGMCTPAGIDNLHVTCGPLLTWKLDREAACERLVTPTCWLFSHGGAAFRKEITPSC